LGEISVFLGKSFGEKGGRRDKRGEEVFRGD